MAATQTVQEATQEQRRVRALLPERIRAMRHPRWWQEIAFVLICYELYSLVRNIVPGQEQAARGRAVDVLHAERVLHIDIEQSVNAFVARTHALAYVCNYYYATLHFVVTIGVMVWLYRRHPLRYRTMRAILLATTVSALLGFWLFALAPPRMLVSRGFVDTIVTFHTWGSWGSAGVDSASNQFAAMPSLHIAWSMWCAIMIVRLARMPIVRALGAVYPIATLFVIIGTANHFVLDAVGGAAALAVGFAVQRVLSGRPAFVPPPATIVTVPAQSKNSRS